MGQRVSLPCPVSNDHTFHTEKLSYSQAKENLDLHIKFNHRDSVDSRVTEHKSISVESSKIEMTEIKIHTADLPDDNQDNRHHENIKSEDDAHPGSKLQSSKLHLGLIQKCFECLCHTKDAICLTIIFILLLAILDGSGDYGVFAFLWRQGFRRDALLVLGTECLAAGTVIGKNILKVSNSRSCIRIMDILFKHSLKATTT